MDCFFQSFELVLAGRLHQGLSGYLCGVAGWDLQGVLIARLRTRRSVFNLGVNRASEGKMDSEGSSSEPTFPKSPSVDREHLTVDGARANISFDLNRAEEIVAKLGGRQVVRIISIGQSLVDYVIADNYHAFLQQRGLVVERKRVHAPASVSQMTLAISSQQGTMVVTIAPSAGKSAQEAEIDRRQLSLF